MRVKLKSLFVLVGSGVIGAVLVAQSGRSQPSSSVEAKLHIVIPSQIKWTDPPAGVARGTPSVEPGSPLQYAALEGDPLKPGVPFAIRLRCSDGYKVAPHWHPEDENIVVLKGTFSVGTGDRFDPGRTQDIPTGGYGLVPGRMNHFALCRGDTDFFVYGIGPRLNYWTGGTNSGTSGVDGKPPR